MFLVWFLACVGMAALMIACLPLFLILMVVILVVRFISQPDRGPRR